MATKTVQPATSVGGPASNDDVTLLDSEMFQSHTDEEMNRFCDLKWYKDLKMTC